MQKNSINIKMLSFQKTIFDLQSFWASQGCAILQPYDIEIGAGTYHPKTTLLCLGEKPIKIAYVQPSRRPTDGRYGNNPNRVQHYYQFQVLLKPSPKNIQDLYLESLIYVGLETSIHDIRFVEDDWENPTLGAKGLGWEVWCNGMEITQFTYFQQMGGMTCTLVSGELTYGLERLSLVLQDKESFFDLVWSPENITYGDLFLQNEKEFSQYNFQEANIIHLKQHFQDAITMCGALLEKKLSLPAYDQCMKASHLFNLLDARGYISPTERPTYISQVRHLACSCCKSYANCT